MLILFSGAPPGSVAGAASGGLTAAGGALAGVGAAPSGGLTSTGASPPTAAAVGVGGLSATGTASAGVSASPAGGLVVSGTAGTSNIQVAQAAGGLVVTGAAAGLGGSPDPGTYPDWQRTTVAPGAPPVCVAGDDQAWTLGLQAPGGGPFVGFTAGNTLTATLWRGGDEAPISGGLLVGYAADYATSGNLVLEAPGSATGPLVRGRFAALVEAAVGSGRRTCWRGDVTVLAASGAGVPGRAYCTRDDAAEYYPEQKRLLPDEGTFDRIAHSAWARINSYFIRERFDPRPDLSRRRQPTPDRFYGRDVPDSATNPPTIAQFRAALGGGGLVLDATDAPEMARIAAGMALDVVLKSKTAGSNAQNPLVQSGRDFGAEAMELLRDFDPYVDMDGDGAADIQIVGKVLVYLPGWPT